MTQPSPLQELACTNCGAPIRTTAAPGATVTCDCCGSAFLIPKRSSTAAIVIENGATIHGGVVAGDKIVAKEGQVVVAGKGAVAVLDKKPVENSSEGKKAGEGR